MIHYVTAMNIPNSQNRLSAYLAELNDFYTRWKIKLNPAKAEAIVFMGLNKFHIKVAIKTQKFKI